MTDKTVFNELNSINVNDYTEKKGNLTYLSWASAWKEVAKRYPDARYEIERFEDNKPYLYEENVGYMVFTRVTINELTHEMWLPVMDFRNKAMLQATMFDINKTIMRCLTKNLAMFGLGLYIYNGEDLPEENTPKPAPIKKPDKKLETKLSNLFELADAKKKSALEMMALMNDKFGVTASTDLTEKQIDELISIISKE